ncbi:MAG: hypothetical protein JJU06_13205 [Ectothiorhodospiraceae bacterium]|nr:hypothetical protein [Ectothiorhodospiraceae bacterium]
MMQVGRVGDIGLGSCSAHDSTKSITVTIVTGAQTVLTNGLQTATLVSVGLGSCGHAATVATVSATVRAEALGVHRRGDIGILPGGTYTLITGSPNTVAGG